MGCCGNRRNNNNVYVPSKLPRGLTPDQIQKLKTNLNNLIDFNDLSYSSSSLIPDEVYRYLKSFQKTDPGLTTFERLLDSSYELIGELPIEGANVFAWFIGGILDSYTQSNPPNLNIDFGDIESRYNKTYLQIRLDLSLIYDDPIKYIDKELPINFGTKKSITLRELINYNLPGKDSEIFSTMLQAHARGFRSALCKQELPKTNQWKLAYVSFDDGCAYIPGNTVREILFHPILWAENFPEKGDSNRANNSEITDRHPNIPFIEVTSQNTNIESMKETLGKFCQLQPQAYVNGYVEHIQYTENLRITAIFKYYLMERFDGPDSWDLANENFCKWLFIDDSFGNVINPDGCGTRSDILRNWGGIANTDKMLGQQELSNDLNDIMKSEINNYVKKWDLKIRIVQEPIIDNKIYEESTIEEVKEEEEIKEEEVKEEEVKEEVKVEPTNSCKVT
jgi:hypothetical protein